ncbi:MAG: hypothetical protein LQ343_005933 [Gyalolechia ehrenbergii]|nr:MAG: hypothetical protein LQ343_005933 [Gyalolechia ehrenbergii]
MPWRGNSSEIERLSGRSLKIGVMWSDDIVTPHPSVTRGLDMMATQLKSLGEVEVVDWRPYDHMQSWEIIASLYYVDGGQQTGDLIASSGEPWRPLSKFIITDNPHAQDRTRADLQDLIKRKERYRLEYASRWNKTATTNADNGRSEQMVDVILCPAGPGPAPFLNCSRYWGYTSQWNLLDYPALVFPVAKFDSTVDQWPQNYVAMNDHDRYNMNLYQPAEAFDGTPISLQLVGRPFEDEKVLEVMKMIRQRLELPFANFG